MSDTEKKFRTTSTYQARNVRVMWVGEPRTVGTGDNEKSLCSARFVDQPGNEKDLETWVTFTGAGRLGEFIYNLKKGDRVNVSGKPYFSSYEKDGETHFTVEIRYPDFVECTYRAPTEDTEEEETEPEPVVEEKKTPAKRGPGRPRKQLQFETDEE